MYKIIEQGNNPPRRVSLLISLTIFQMQWWIKWKLYRRTTKWTFPLKKPRRNKKKYTLTKWSNKKMFSYDQITHKLTHTHTLLHNSFKFVIGLLSRFICLFHVQRVTAIRKYKSSKTILIVRSHLERNANIRYTKFCNSFSLFRSSLCNINNANSGRVETKHRFTCFQIHTHSPRKYL